MVRVYATLPGLRRLNFRVGLAFSICLLLRAAQAYPIENTHLADGGKAAISKVGRAGVAPMFPEEHGRTNEQSLPQITATR